jgi:flagellar protein FlgJ
MRLPLANVQSGLPLQAVAKTGGARIDEAARGLETSFAKLLISQMRTSGLGGDAMFPGAAAQYRDLYDSQLAEQITKGKGLGLQPMIKRELERSEGVAETPAAPKFFSLDNVTRPALALALPTTTAAAAVAKLTYRALSPTTPLPAPAQSPAPSPSHAATAAVAPDKQSFVSRLWGHAQQAANELGVDAKTLIAQVALETGWGKHMIQSSDGSTANNLFGIKASGNWKGASATNATTEYVNGSAQTEQAAFRAYDSAAASFDDYVRLLKTSPRYADALKAGGDGRRFAQELQRAGYATDPAYAAKITAIAEGPTLQRVLEALPAARDMSTTSTPDSTEADA